MVVCSEVSEEESEVESSAGENSRFPYAEVHVEVSFDEVFVKWASKPNLVHYLLESDSYG